MKMFITFTHKELVEQWRNYKILILFAVLVSFGMLSPVFAKMLPEILSQIDVGITISFPEPTFIDSYVQFFKNMTQVGVIAVILIFSSNISEEVQKGTAILMLSKGLSKFTFIISKFVSEVIIWTLAYSVSAAFCIGYTDFLFPSQTPKNIVFSLFCFWLFVVFILSVITLMSVIFNQSYISILLTAGVIVCLLIINIFPQTIMFSPIALTSYNLDLISGAKEIKDAFPALFISSGLIFADIFTAVSVFKRRQL